MAWSELASHTPSDVGQLLIAWCAKERRLDVRAGIALSAMAMMHSGGKSRLHPWDFYASIPEPPPLSDEEVEARIRAALLGR